MSSSRVVRRVSALAGAIRVGPAEGETPDPLARLSPEERAAHERRAAEAAEQTRTLAEARQRAATTRAAPGRTPKSDRTSTAWPS